MIDRIQIFRGRSVVLWKYSKYIQLQEEPNFSRLMIKRAKPLQKQRRRSSDINLNIFLFTRSWPLLALFTAHSFVLCSPNT